MILKIKNFGYSCFLIETYDGVRVVTDPYNDNVGYSLPKNLMSDIVLVSHSHQAHSCISAVNGNPAVYQGPGYRECGWVKIKGISSFHDNVKGEKYGSNTIFCWDMRAVKLCHLGDLGCIPDTEILKQIGVVDILFIPIGSRSTIDLEQAEKLIALLQCKYVIPMKYKTKYNDREKNTLVDFLKDKKNVIVPSPKNEFVLDRKNMAVKEKTILAMEYIEDEKK